jgi:cytochrome c551/c552
VGRLLGFGGVAKDVPMEWSLVLKKANAQELLDWLVKIEGTADLSKLPRSKWMT